MASAVKRLCSNRILCAPARPAFAARPQWQRTRQCQQRLFSAGLVRAQEQSDGVDPDNENVNINDPDTWEEQIPRDMWVTETDAEPDAEHPVDKASLGFWAEGEEELGPDEEFHGDDISTIAHGHLEMHRERREYARIAAWELPLLSKLHKPFELPQKTQPLRFRYTTYLGEEHPAAHKVVLEFCPSDLPDLTVEQRAKLIKICGPRYNPSTEIVKMSCENFDNQMQNKRFLIDVVNSLIREAKDPKDTFADVPFDFRHHKPKPTYKFPTEWIMTEERKKLLQEKREQSLLEDQKRLQDGTLVDGLRVIEGHLTSPIGQMVEIGARPVRPSRPPEQLK